MASLRILVALVAYALGSPAAAQVSVFELDNLRAQQEAALRRAIDQENQFQALDARLRADRAAAPTERAVVSLPTVPYPTSATPPEPPAPSAYPAMSDAALAESNRRIQDAVKRRP